jgi:hypothetical protein
MSIKFINAKQTTEMHPYKNTRRKLYKTNAAIWFNKTCRDKQLTPNYINIKINGNNRQCNSTIRTAVRYRLNQGVKFLNIKKQKLYEQPYKHHLKCAATWHNPWLFIQNHIDGNPQLETEALYDNLNRKIDNLINKQLRKTRNHQPNQHQRVYQRTINLTNIRFTKEEQTVLDYGLQYSLEKALKTYWMNLIIETERTIKLLDSKSQNAFCTLASRKLKQIYSSNNINATQNANYTL